VPIHTHKFSPVFLGPASPRVRRVLLCLTWTPCAVVREHLRIRQTGADWGSVIPTYEKGAPVRARSIIPDAAFLPDPPDRLAFGVKDPADAGECLAPPTFSAVPGEAEENDQQGSDD
jgi:hypothetical protein